MKMKEVCTRTGLTERTVRFYVQEKLVTPLAQRRNGRTWLDFSEADLERLNTVAVLRKAGFTLEEIRAMLSDFAASGPQAAFALGRRLEEAEQAHARLLEADPAGAWSVEELARRLSQPVERSPVPASDQAQPWVDAAAILERLGMVLLAAAGFWAYAKVWDALCTDPLWNAAVVILFPMVYLTLVLPVCLVLGSRLGRWVSKKADL